jgi:hypothetical protein
MAERHRRTVWIAHHLTGGHRFYYDRLLVERVLELGARPVLAVPRGHLAAEELALHLDGPMADRLQVEWLDPSAAEPRRFLSELGARIGADDVLVLPDVDGLLPVLALRGVPGARAVIGLVLATPSRGAALPLRTRLGNLRRAARARAASARGVEVFQLGEATGNDRPHWTHLGIPVVRDPSPAWPLPGRAEARRRLGIPDDAFLLATLGVQREDKALPLVVDAWSRSAVRRDAAASPVLLSAGLHISTTGAFMAERAAADPTIRVEDRMLTDDELAVRLVASDAVVHAHVDDKPSGMVAAAVRARVPIVAVRRNRISHLVERTGIGTVAARDPDSLAAAIDAIRTFQPPPSWPELPPESAFAATLLSPSVLR